VKKYLFCLLLVLYYSLLVFLVIVMHFRLLTFMSLSFIVFSIIDLFLLKIFLSSKYKILLILYILLSYCLCAYIFIFIEEYYPPLTINIIIQVSLISLDFLLSKDFLSLLFFDIFIIIKIFPCIVTIKYINYSLQKQHL
jgi:hypothetical protein